MSNSKSRSGQKFIARNRAPRVQIEYDVEIYGAERKIQLPFVMGVMADLVGKAVDPQASVEERKFMEIDVDNFDERMRALAAAVAPVKCASTICTLTRWSTSQPRRC